MERFIRNSLNRIYTEFKSEIKGREDLCEIKNCHFENNNIPDYSSKLSQKYYLMRYFPIYFLEYYYIYFHLLSEKFLENKNIKIVSIGSGCGLDFYGFYWAVKNLNLELNCSEKYLGIDMIDWDYKDLLKKENISIIINDISKYKTIDSSFDVFIFPKSIGELDIKSYNKLLEIFSNSKINKSKVVLISSMVASQVRLYIDRIVKVANIIIEKGYKTRNILDEYYYLTPEFNVKNYFSEEITWFIIGLYNKCKKIGNCNEYSRCVQILNKYPILYSKYIKYNVIKLEKDR